MCYWQGCKIDYVEAFFSNACPICRHSKSQFFSVFMHQSRVFLPSFQIMLWLSDSIEKRRFDINYIYTQDTFYTF